MSLRDEVAALQHWDVHVNRDATYVPGEAVLLSEVLDIIDKYESDREDVERAKASQPMYAESLRAEGLTHDAAAYLAGIEMNPLFTMKALKDHPQYDPRNIGCLWDREVPWQVGVMILAAIDDLKKTVRESRK